MQAWSVIAAETWGLGWEALVAVGTLALAAATAYLGFETRDVARAAKKEIDAASRTVVLLSDASDPVLVTEYSVRPMVHNVGSGPAIDSYVGSIGGAQDQVSIAPGNRGPVMLEARSAAPQALSVATPSQVEIVVCYLDLSNQRHYTTISGTLWGPFSEGVYKFEVVSVRPRGTTVPHGRTFPIFGAHGESAG